MASRLLAALLPRDPCADAGRRLLAASLRGLALCAPLSFSGAAPPSPPSSPGGRCTAAAAAKALVAAPAPPPLAGALPGRT